MRYLIVILLASMLQQNSSFKEKQLKNSRVKNAYDEKETFVRKLFADKNLSYRDFQLFIRAFKKEKILELWVKPKNDEKFSLLTTHSFCSSSGVLGPKRKEGDLQIPEGIYHINHFNPLSNFHLSLGVSYPNASDRILSDRQHPGGAIYVHGNCVTVGCIPITDEKIKEVYLIAVEARNAGQEKIPIHIFPSRMDQQAFSTLRTNYATSPSLIKFWENLQTVYLDFESRKRLIDVKVNKKGEYFFDVNL